MRKIPKVGQVIEFNYDSHDPIKERIGRVTSVRDTHIEPVQVKTRANHPEVTRSRFLISCAMFDGTYRNFYHVGLTNVRKVGIIRRTLLRLSGVHFGEIARNVNKVAEVRRRGD
jgi:hypothetical protein